MSTIGGELRVIFHARSAYGHVSPKNRLTTVAACYITVFALGKNALADNMLFEHPEHYQLLTANSYDISSSTKYSAILRAPGLFGKRNKRGQSSLR